MLRSRRSVCARRRGGSHASKKRRTRSSAESPSRTTSSRERCLRRSPNTVPDQPSASVALGSSQLLRRCEQRRTHRRSPTHGAALL